MPRVIIEVEFKHRSLSQLAAHAAVLLGEPLVAAVLGFVVYRKWPDGTFALLSVLFQCRPATNVCYVSDLVSFGTRPLHAEVLQVVDGLPRLNANSPSPLRVLPSPSLPVPFVPTLQGHEPHAWAGQNTSIVVPGSAIFHHTVTAPAPPLPDMRVSLWTVLEETADVMREHS